MKKGENGLLCLDVELPRRDEDGNYYISYSQYTSFTSESGYNTGMPGFQEYMLQYFLGMNWPDSGYAKFGQDVEDYICDRVGIEKFTHKERQVMDQIVPLGNFQVEVKLWLAGNVYLKGFIDDATADFKKIRDYKTCSESKKSKYESDDYKQLDLYSLWVKQETGSLPEELEVCAIKRVGSCHNMVNRRDLLAVGDKYWIIPRTTSEERCEAIKADLMKTVMIISDYYKVFKKVNK